MNNYRISLRYKLALPVSISVFVILVLLTHTTIRIVRESVTQQFEAHIAKQAEEFSGPIQPTFLARNFTFLQFYLDALAARGEIYGVQLVDREGLPILQSPIFRKLPILKENFAGAKSLFAHQSLLSVLLRLEGVQAEGQPRRFPELFVALAPLERGTRVLGRLRIFYTTHQVNETIRKIYRKRILFSFLASLGIAFLTSALTWLAIRPLFRLRSTVQDILRGQTGARARIHSMDEIEDLSEAFNEMLGRLEQSMQNLRLRTEALEESEEKYRALVENASDVIWLLSTQGEIIFINQGFAGLAREDLLRDGLSLFLSFHTEESIELFNAALDEVKRQKIPVNHVATVFHHPQTHGQVYYSTNLTPVFTYRRELKAIQAVSRDVTEIKRIEMMKDRLIRDVTHELKTPVAKFQMTLNWLEKEFMKETEDRRHPELVELMKRNADLLMNMIMQIMNLSRLEAGTEHLERKSCDLNQIVTRVCDDMEPLVRERKLHLDRKIADGSLPFLGDETMLYRLFTNLLVNAIKFTPEGIIAVETEKNGEKIRAKVSDTGIGLEPEDLKRVFDRFYQKSPATKGMGIGLALAREIAVLHGGRIWAESRGLGKGSAFIVEFPQ